MQDVLPKILRGYGFLLGDVLIVDASAPPAAGKIAIVMIHGEVRVARIGHRDGRWWLRPGHADVWTIVDGPVRLRMWCLPPTD